MKNKRKKQEEIVDFEIEEDSDPGQCLGNFLENDECCLVCEISETCKIETKQTESKNE